MKWSWQKLALGVAGFLLTCLLLLVTIAQLTWSRTFDAPLPDLPSSLEPEVVARGAYLANGPAHCADCHTAPGSTPFAGGREWVLPFGVVRSPNITPDVETGIGRFSDAQLARTLRYGVRHDGRAALPFMEFQNLAEEDIAAVLAYLRSLEPVRNETRDHTLNLLGKAVMAFLIKPVGPSSAPLQTAPRQEPTIERGAYLANSVANCAGCHSERNPLDGSYIGARFAGGGRMDLESDPSRVLVTPNLTPDARTGHMVNWPEEVFVRRFRAGPQIPDSHMPWGAYNAMSDDDLRALYRYLMSLEPVENETGPLIQPKS